MRHTTLLVPPSASFWTDAADALLGSDLLHQASLAPMPDLSAVRVVVPTFSHAQLLKSALTDRIGRSFIPPRISTLSAWLGLLPIDGRARRPTAESERLLGLYAELRQHAWLKKLFGARRNTDLLPLAQTLLTLCDELTMAMLPSLALSSEGVESRWEAALAQLSPSARQMLSDETQLVWSIWKSQLDANDALAFRFAQMLRASKMASQPLTWISPVEPDAFEQTFLSAYAKRQPVLSIKLDWRVAALDPAYALAWREMQDEAPMQADLLVTASVRTPIGLALCAAKSLEDEAVLGAQTIINWLQSGKSSIAIIAQDRIVARRIRALLERARVFVADETGWKLSTTRAASAIAAWFDVIAARGETTSLLDLLKSPFFLTDAVDKSTQVMAIEIALRSANVAGGWRAIVGALSRLPAGRESVLRIIEQVEQFSDRRTLCEWITSTRRMMHALSMHDSLANDAAGKQVIALIEGIEQDCEAITPTFSFSEWRAFIAQQMESTTFVAPEFDRRVAMLPLNGARLRTFDAVLVVGADAAHLPSQPNETLFFANAVRRELGLATRESRQRQQLRDFAELLSANDDVVLSWQAFKDGEPNPASPWIERLQLTLARAGVAPLATHAVGVPLVTLAPLPPVMPRPSAPSLRPAKLTASGYNSFVACPYQFFVTRMLGLSGIDELSDLPEKRDYGDWLHQILNRYHETLRDDVVAFDRREALLAAISDDVFGRALSESGAALGYYVRWQKAQPAYLQWANEREEQGWRFVLGEERSEKILQWEDGDILLHGRIDRIDETAAGERAVLDYKTSSVQILRNKIKQREDQQLAFYGLISETTVGDAHFVALDPANGKIDDIKAPDYPQWQQALREQIVSNMGAIDRAAALPATGIESVCQYCDVRGLCRKGAW